MKRFITSLLKETMGFIFLYFGGIPILKKNLKGKDCLVVLNYHNFSLYNNYKIKRGGLLDTGYIDNFEKQIKFLKKHFDYCYPKELQEKKLNSGIQILITFDDGYKDNFDLALPILKKYNAKAIFFIATSFINSKNWLEHDKLRYLVQSGTKKEFEVENVLMNMNKGYPIDKWLKENKDYLIHPDKRLMMNWNEVREISKNGFIIGPHTHNHKILTFLDYKNQEVEILSSVKLIQKEINSQSKYFAYPNGLYDDNSISILEKSNIEYAFTTEPGFNYSLDSPYILKRIGINASDSIGVLLLKLFLNRNK